MQQPSKSGTFTLPSGLELLGELTLDGANTSLHLRGKGRGSVVFDVHHQCITGILHDLIKVSLIDCNTQNSGHGARGTGMYHYANLFPHFVVFGDRHVNIEERHISAIRFILDDAGVLFHNFDSFGWLPDAGPVIGQILASAQNRPSALVAGPEPQVLYFNGKCEIFSANTSIGKISSRHNPVPVLNTSGVALQNKITTSIEFEEYSGPRNSDQAIS